MTVHCPALSIPLLHLVAKSFFQLSSTTLSPLLRCITIHLGKTLFGAGREGGGGGLLHLSRKDKLEDMCYSQPRHPQIPDYNMNKVSPYHACVNNVFWNVFVSKLKNRLRRDFFEHRAIKRGSGQKSHQSLRASYFQIRTCTVGHIVSWWKST